MFNIESNIATLPGLPGYGLSGNDGERGLNGISLYISSLNGKNDAEIITEDIRNHYDLNGSGLRITGYPYRMYQTGDYFIDIASEIYQIDLGDIKKFKPTSLKLNSFDIFEFSKIINDYKYNRYVNMSNTNNKIIIDTVLSENKNNYISSLDNTIYGVSYKDYAKVFYDDLTDSSAIINFALLSGGNQDHGAIVLRYDNKNKQYILGNKDASDNIRNTNLYLDFNNVIVNRGHILNIDDSIGNILTTSELITSCLFDFNNDPEGISLKAQNDSVTISWNKSKFFKNRTISDLNKIRVDLIFYKPTNISGLSFDFETTKNNNIYIYDLTDIGTVTITNLLQQSTYKCYLQFSYANYSRTSNVLTTITGLTPTLTLTCGGVTYKNGDTLTVPAMLSSNTYTFNLSTNGGAIGWSISERYNTFTTITPKNGNGNGNFNVNINSNNYAATDRTDKFNIALDQYSSTEMIINIKQEAFNGQLSVSHPRLDFSYTGEVKAFGITTNLGAWTILGPQWCEINSPNGMVGNQTVNVKPISNDSTLARIDNITIISTNRPDISANVIVTQEGKPPTQNWIKSTTTGMVFDGDGTAQTISFEFDNDEYFNITVPSWMTANPANGYPTVQPPNRVTPYTTYVKRVTFSCSSYIGSLRNGMITITHGNASLQIGVTQNSIVSPPSINPGSGGGGGGCLEISTPVTLSNGFPCNVGDLKPGYKILSHNGEDIHEFGYKGYDTKPRLIENTVLANEIKEFDYYYEINNEFKCSATHNLFVFRNGVWQWILSPYLKEGDLMFHISGNKVPITSIKHVNAPIKVAYLSLMRPNTYFAAGYLHHNTAAEKEIAID